MHHASQEPTQDLYNRHTHLWIRKEPTILSDYTARPRVLESVGTVDGLDILDLGCGEGYLSRALYERGAASVMGLDISEQMVRAANEQNAHDGYQIVYETRDLRNWQPPKAQFDRAIAVFLFNYLNLQDSMSVLTHCRRALKDDGELVLTLPHPSLPWLRAAEAPFYFERPSLPYRGARDMRLKGRIWQRAGQSVPVVCFHKTMEDIFRLLSEAGFSRVLEFNELYVTDEHKAIDPLFFGPLEGTPLHVLLKVAQ